MRPSLCLALANCSLAGLLLLLLSPLLALALPSAHAYPPPPLPPSTDGSAQLIFDAAPPNSLIPASHDQPHASSENLVDLIARSRDHNILLRLLQRTRLIPTLNRLQQLDNRKGITLLAPTDQAFLRKRQQQHDARLQSVQPHPEARGIWEWLLTDEPHLNLPPDATLPIDYHHTDKDAFNDDDSDDDNDHVAAAQVRWIWQDGGVTVRDNIHAVARQHLLYHLLNYTLPYNLTSDTGSHRPDGSLPPVGKPHVHETMHFPSRRLLLEPTRPGHISAPDQEDHGGLIGDEGQKIRVSTVEIDAKPAGADVDRSKRRPKQTKALVFGTDHYGRGGARSLDENWSSRYGVIYSIDDVLELPPSLQTVLETHPSLEKLRSLLTPDLIKTMSTTAHLSLFLPTSEAFGSLSEIEWRFLSGKWQQSFQDRLRLMGWHVSGVGVGGGKPAYSDRLRSAGDSNLTTVLGGQVSIKVKDDGPIYVDDGRVVEEDIFTENGVIHLVDSLILPFGDLDMTAEKYLLALNATRFVELFYQAGLEDYIRKSPRSKDAYTFLAPRDDVIDDWLRYHHLDPDRLWSSGSKRNGGDSLGVNDDKTPTLEEVVKYHILPGQVRPKDLTDGMLLGTELHDWKLREGRQRIPVQVDDQAAPSRRGNGDVGFGDANVLREPVEIKDSAMIYVISQLLEPPSNPIQTAVSRLTLSTFVATVFSADLKKAVQRAPGITYLIPTNDAFSGLGLAMSYLLLPESQPQLQALIEYHSVDRIVYMEDFERNATELPTLVPAYGANVIAEKLKNGTVLVSRAGDDRDPPARVTRGDILTNTGVIHEIDRVEMPLDVTIKNLMQGAKAETMQDLVQQAGYGWILNGTAPPSASDRPAATGVGGRSFVILVPTDNAFTHVNLSRILEDPVSLQQLVEQHIIPLGSHGSKDGLSVDDILPDGRRNRLSISDTSSFPTLLDASAGGDSRYGRVSFRRVADNEGLSGGYNGGNAPSSPSDDDLGYLVGIAGTRGTDSNARRHSARVLRFGRESRGFSVGRSDALPSKLTNGVGGVILIDTVLEPYRPGWFYRWGWIVLAATVAAVAMSAATLAAYRWWNRDGKVRLPDALEGEEE